MNFAVAVKALILHEGTVLLLKRRSNDVHKPGRWDIPGGRLATGENPISGLERECLEEAGLQVTVVAPVGTDHFVRDDGQTITMIIFLCESSNAAHIQLSEEHVEFKWVPLTKEQMPDWLYGTVDSLHLLQEKLRAISYEIR